LVVTGPRTTGQNNVSGNENKNPGKKHPIPRIIAQIQFFFRSSRPSHAMRSEEIPSASPKNAIEHNKNSAKMVNRTGTAGFPKSLLASIAKPTATRPASTPSTPTIAWTIRLGIASSTLPLDKRISLPTVTAISTRQWVLQSTRKQFSLKSHKCIPDVVGRFLHDASEIGCTCSVCLAFPNGLKQLCGLTRHPVA
jgi:hypothetical protein